MTKEFFNSKKTKIIITAIIMVTSIAFSFIASDPSTHKLVYEALDAKKMEVTIISSSSTALAVALSATEILKPIAEILTNVASYCIVITSVIFFEKFLLTTFGMLTFAIIIPISCLLLIIYLLFGKESLKQLSIKLISFGLVMFLTVPVSTYVSTLVDKTYTELYSDAISEIEQTSTINEDDLKGLKKWGNKIKESIEEKVNKFTDAIAVLLITTCAIPMASMALMFWLTKTLFSLDIKPKKNIAFISNAIKATGQGIGATIENIK